MGHGIEWKVSLIHSALARRDERRRWSRLRGTGVIGSANVDNVRKWHSRGLQSHRQRVCLLKQC
jgi:hypothetical protein